MLVSTKQAVQLQAANKHEWNAIIRDTFGTKVDPLLFEIIWSDKKYICPFIIFAKIIDKTGGQ